MFKRSKVRVQLVVKGYKEIYQMEPKMLWISLGQGIFEAVMPFIILFFTSSILNQLFIDPSFEELTPLIIFTLAATFISTVLSRGLEHYYWKIRARTLDKKTMRMNKKITYMDYEFIENSEVHEMKSYLEIAEMTGGTGLYDLIHSTKQIINQFVTVVIASIIVLPLFFTQVDEDSGLTILDHPIFLGVGITGLILYFLYASSVYKKVTIIINKVLKDGEHSNNLFGFLFSQLLNYQSGKEIRLYKQQKLYQKVFGMMDQLISEGMLKIAKVDNKATVKLQILIHIILGSGYLFTALKAIGGAIPVGAIVLYTGAISNFIQGFPELVSGISRLLNNEEMLKKYFEFMELKSNKPVGTLPVEKRTDNEYELEVRNVSFKYPGTEEYVLKNVNMKLSIGEKMAIVGMNGSGKTTFIKLLARLYDPSEGEILLNGIDIRKYDYDEYLQLFSVVFQDFNLFSFELGQNIATSTEYEAEKLMDSIEKAGFKERFDQLPQKLDTYLYQDFDKDGVEISGGEAQKIAMARALYKNAPIVILDEPTAALDPISEFEIYSKFHDIVGNKTALFISHRLSSCRFCDEIVVFHEGEIIQRGPHDSLVKDKDGKYFELWNAQAQYYTKDDEGDIKEIALV